MLLLEAVGMPASPVFTREVLGVNAMNATTNNNNNTVTKTQKLLTAVVVLQVLTLLGQWTGQPGTSTVSAAIPDPGAQRQEQVAQQKETNEKLDKLINLLKSGDVKVTVEKSDK
jgi:hypothetical protein